MARVRDLWSTAGNRTARHGKGRRWLAVWHDDSGRERSKVFRTRTEAERFARHRQAETDRGLSIDFRAASQHLGDFYAGWSKSRAWAPTTRQANDLRWRVHLAPTFGTMPISRIRPSHVAHWLATMTDKGLAPSTIKGCFAVLSGCLNAACADGLIATNPANSPVVTLPKRQRRELKLWTLPEVHSVAEALPDEYRALVPVMAGLGLRQSEAFALSLDDVDFLRREVQVRRQVRIHNSRLVYATPKHHHTRRVPMPEFVALALSRHIAANPPAAVTLPVDRADATEHETAELLFHAPRGGALSRNTFNVHVWKPALKTAGLEASRANGCHALRHYYASTALGVGLAVPEVARWLGHQDGGALLLRTYAHVLAGAEDRARSALDGVWATADGTVTEQATAS